MFEHEQARFVPNDFSADNRFLKSALEAAAEGCEVDTGDLEKAVEGQGGKSALTRKD